jgi:chromosome segregation ATPase
MGALEEEPVTGLNHQVSRKLGALEDQVQGLEKGGGGKAIDGYEFGKPVLEIKRVRWQNVEYKHASSDEGDIPQELGKRADMPDSELEYETASKLPGSQMQAKGNVNPLLTRALSKGNSFMGQISPRSSPRDAQEIVDLVEKAKFLEAALKAKSMEIESLKQTCHEKETDLLDKIECLELANEQLLQGGSDAGTEQLQMELTRLQKQNALLAQRERELQFQLSTKDMLQQEVSHLQELNQQLMDDRLQTTVDPDEPVGKLAEKIAFLETELAEAIEVNNMYKSQLQFAFSKQENVQAAALQNFGNVDDIIHELLQLRQQTKTQETELQDLRDRFFLMSIHLAETEASREELHMKVKRLQNLLRH